MARAMIKSSEQITTKSILMDPAHALCEEFERLPHGGRFRSLTHKSNKSGNSFVPNAVQLLNRCVLTVLHGSQCLIRFEWCVWVQRWVGVFGSYVDSLCVCGGGGKGAG